ncbi:S1C family serine protease [Nocardioides sp.]|uniref:S1C family serine protease n=1 Tax=Nocardioides sp. TaxID=35761 RepID=UPI002F4297D3
MDEQAPRSGENSPTDGPADNPADNPARYGAPLPPPPVMGWVPPPPTPPRRRRRRLAAAGTALAVVAVAGGAGFALGRLDHQVHASAGTPAAGSGGEARDGQGFGEPPFGNTDPFGGTPFSGPGGTGGTPFDSASSGTPATDSQLTGLVRIASTLTYANGRAAGTGMILTSTGEVVTNHHVVEGSTKLRVTVMSTGRSYRATVVGTDAQDDVAVLQLRNATGLQTVTPDTDGISVGDAVTAVGDAGGDTSTFTAAAGKILATRQHITTRSEGSASSEKLHGLIEISSDVISGDSGGATYDDEGEVVGMTTAASSGTRDVVGYAIPIAKVVRIAADLESGTQNARYDYGSPAFLGVGLGGSTTRVGVVYPGTPAARAGLTTGDTITRVGTTSVHTASQLRDAITAYSPGDRVRLGWTDRDGRSHISSVKLMAGPIA